ncbi:MAG: hypothetical protein RSD85_02040 [Erysipelotrichaceae bacterium]
MKYRLMNKDIEILDFSYDEETHNIDKIIDLIHPEYAPLGIIDYKTGISRKSFNNWWRDRAIPASRSKFKEVLEQLDITSSIELLERCFGLSLSDQYWIKEEDSLVSWSDVNFFTNDFSEDMGKLLMGQRNCTDSLNIFSPDNSSDGNLRKKWKIINGKRCLIKSGNTLNNQEPFNEVIATKLYEKILHEDEFVPYYLIEENGITYCCCETMVGIDEELVPAFYIDASKKLHGSDLLYEYYIDVCNELGILEAKIKINKMLVCDYILGNYDRHYRNFGAIRNVLDLKWTRIAPIYDSGSSLWATTPVQLIGTAYKSKPFKSNAEEQLNLVNDLSWLNINNILDFDRVVYDILDKNIFMDETRKSAIFNQVKIRIQKVLERQLFLNNEEIISKKQEVLER